MLQVWVEHYDLRDPPLLNSERKRLRYFFFLLGEEECVYLINYGHSFKLRICGNFSLTAYSFRGRGGGQIISNYVIKENLCKANPNVLIPGDMFTQMFKGLRDRYQKEIQTGRSKSI